MATIMSDTFPKLEDRHLRFIGRQHLFFVATAGALGHVNLSPKGMDSLRMVDAARVLWLNLTGSGNETAAHVLENGRMTIMFCSFDDQPMILRLYGTATVIHRQDERWPALAGHFPRYAGARQLFDLKLELVQTSCGYAVPFFEYGGQRPTLENWAEKQGPKGIEAYWKSKNTVSLDGRPTGIEDNFSPSPADGEGAAK